MPEPAILVTYGFSKSGKTTDLLYSFPSAPFLVPAKTGLAPWVMRTGIRPAEIEVSTVADATKQIRKLAAKSKAICLDDFSVLVERTKTHLRQTGYSGWELWVKIADQIEDLREVAIKMNVSLAICCHEAPPKTDKDNTFHRGGPKMPSKSLIGALPHIAAYVARTGPDMMTQPPLFNGAYIVDTANRDYITGDRYGVVPQGKGPMNLREILVRAREVGHDLIVPLRPPALTWMDEVVELVASYLQSNPAISQAQIAQEIAALPQCAGKDPKHLAWIHRDGYARATLRSTSAYSAYILPTPDGVSGQPSPPGAGTNSPVG